jgi:drug/metabolite transporter (DMT)-like permease
VSERHRPVGLTALAVLNFVLAGLSTISYAGLLTLLAEHGGGPDRIPPDAPGAGSVYFVFFAGLVCAALLIASGVGYLKQHDLLGRTLGNAYAPVALANAVYELAILREGFGLATVINAVYPVVTLILLNAVFKRQFAAAAGEASS